MKERYIIKLISIILLIIVWSLFFLTDYKDVILLYFLLFINGLLFEKNKKEILFYSITLLIFLLVNLIVNLKFKGVLTDYFFSSILVLINFPIFFFLGKVTSLVLKKQESFLRLLTIWTITFIISQFALTYIDKEYLDNHFYIVIIIYLLNFFISGFYIARDFSKTKYILIYQIIPLILIVIIIITSEKNYIKPLMFVLAIIIATSIGFYIKKLKIKYFESKKNATVEI
ncbi:MAG: hypothetical protein LBE39_12070 [Flavobacteriaceae bacterium]|jgi:hypothetical protein|nr:hypothetical protein [Flavobacteriaceae bacterium]